MIDRDNDGFIDLDNLRHIYASIGKGILIQKNGSSYMDVY